MGANQQAMGGEGLIGDSLNIGQPLAGQRGPVKGATVHDIIEEDSILLPYLVLFVDDFLLGDQAYA